MPVKVLGAGQFGEVYKATQQLKSGKKIDRAVKLLKPSSAKHHKADFVRECEMQLKIGDQENCARMVGVGIQQAPWLCILEIIEHVSQPPDLDRISSESINSLSARAGDGRPAPSHTRLGDY